MRNFQGGENHTNKTFTQKHNSVEYYLKKFLKMFPGDNLDTGGVAAEPFPVAAALLSDKLCENFTWVFVY